MSKDKVSEKAVPLFRGPSELFGCTPGDFIYTTAKDDELEPTGYSVIDHKPTKKGKRVTDVIEADTGETIANIELRPGTQGAILIVDGNETEHFTATSALAVLLEDRLN